MQPMEELRSVSKLLESNPELMAGLGAQLSEMRTPLQGLTVQPP
jgi:hypothetical protein